MNCCFMAWNPFQINQFASVLPKFPGSRVVIVDKGSNLAEFDFKKLRGLRYAIVKKNHVPALDGAFDIIFFQSPFPYIEEFRLSKLVSVQYGLAKERHNYGEWRALADMNLMYGPYSAAAAAPFAPSYAVGNPKFDRWKEYLAPGAAAAAKRRLGCAADRKTLLYMPTWGELGSFGDLVGAFSRLESRYDLILKMHHNNEHELRGWAETARRHGLKRIFGGGADQLELLAAADLVVSDYSGAIFDAVYARRPVILYQPDPEAKQSVQKFTLESLEFRERDRLGKVCAAASDLESDVAAVLADPEAFAGRCGDLYERLFLRPAGESDAGSLIRGYSEKLLNGEIPPLTPAQRCVRDAVRELRRLKRTLRV